MIAILKLWQFKKRSAAGEKALGMCVEGQVFSELCHLAADSAAYEAGVAEQERNVCDL